MGLDRLAAVLQNEHNNYDADILKGIINKAAEMAEMKDLTDPSLRVIADHLRSSSFLIADGVLP